MIKNFLRRFFPLTIHTFEIAFKDLYVHFFDLKREISASGKRIKKIEAEQHDLKSLLIENMDHVHLSDVKKETSALEKRIIKLEEGQKNLKSMFYENMDPELYPHALKQWYLNVMGDPLNLENPTTFNEKIQWLKLYDQDPRKTLLTDKYLVREWVKEKIGEKYLIPLIGVYRDAKAIDFSSLPEEFVIKSNHASGQKIIVRDGKKPDVESIRKTADGWLKINFAFQNGFELQYNNISRRLLIEEYLKTKNGKAPEFKLWCFNGRCRFIEAIIKSQKDIRVSFYDCEWNILPFTFYGYQPVSADYPMPYALPEMIRIAETLASDFIHVRVDLYLLDDNNIKFGEMTFTSASGAHKWDPPEADLMIGGMMDLYR